MSDKLRQAAQQVLDALWVCAEHNTLYHGENHNTVIQARAAHEALRTALAEQQEPVGWLPGHPPFPQDQEWFIAETVYGDRVCLRSLDEGREHKGNYAFTTADGTYVKAEIVRRWMQFPDCEYLPPSAPEAPQPAKPAEQEPWTPREIELIDGMIEVQLNHAELCDYIANRTMAEKQKGWDMERVALLQKIRAHGIGGQV